MFLIVVCVLIGSYLGRVLANDLISLPAFVWTLFIGVVLRNSLSLTGLRQIDDQAVNLLGTISLSLFLAMALIALRLWELVSLALPILVIQAALPRLSGKICRSVHRPGAQD